MITKQCKPYTLSEALLKHMLQKWLELHLIKRKIKLQQILLSNDTVQRRIAYMSDNIKEQVIAEIKNLKFGLFSI